MSKNKCVILSSRTGQSRAKGERERGRRREREKALPALRGLSKQHSTACLLERDFLPGRK